MNKTYEKENGVITQEDADKLKNLLNSHLSNDYESSTKRKNSTTSKNPDKKGFIKSKGITIQCRVCNKSFTMSSSELRFYEAKGFQLPQRCKYCRDKGVMYSDEDYYDRGLKHNSYQNNLEMYGPMKNVSGGMDNSPGYFLAKDKDGNTVYIRAFGDNTEIVKFDYFKDWS